MGPVQYSIVFDILSGMVMDHGLRIFPQASCIDQLKGPSASEIIAGAAFMAVMKNVTASFVRRHMLPN